MMKIDKTVVIVGLAVGMRVEIAKRFVDTSDTGLAGNIIVQTCRSGPALSVSNCTS
jgi:hypothetical protein